MRPSTSVRIVEETPAYWRVLFDNPPLNVVDGGVFEGRPSGGCFESVNPEFYLAHFDMTASQPASPAQSVRSGLPIPTDAFVRLTKSAVVSIAKIRGRVRGVGSEFILACDMRFASRETAILGQPEVGAGVIPGGGAAERLRQPGTRRIASFDRRPIAAAKNLINDVSLPSVDRLLDARNAFATTLTWPETQQRVHTLLKRELQQEGDLENHFGARVATLLDT